VSSADEATQAIRDVRASGVRLLVADLAAVELDRILSLAEVQGMVHWIDTATNRLMDNTLVDQRRDSPSSAPTASCCGYRRRLGVPSR
jgi:hypothetical protein